jgi:thiol-disulfide isomerase/thioredoxin
MGRRGAVRRRRKIYMPGVIGRGFFRDLKSCAGILLSGLLAASCASLGPSDASGLIGKPAPDFSTKAIDGERVNLSDFRGNVVVVDFWATWCSSCQKSLPHLEKVGKDAALAGRGLRIVAVDCGEDEKTARQYLQRRHLSLRVIEDEDGSLQRAYAVHVLPVTIVIGRDGAVTDVLIASADAANESDDVATEAKLDAAIEKALAERAK